MSRTDKDRPLWVKQNDPTLRNVYHEQHDHRFGYCDFDEWTGKNTRNRTHCDRSWGYNWTMLVGSHTFGYANLFERAERARVRDQLHEVKKMSREDVADVDIISVQHRHSALWWTW
ncbi:MAG TPA: hypothetical protein VHK27_11165 [Gammaproteobacteria bacterium]|nr:hypothetical protein [Gammaproteobacteria bacterium]